VAALCEALGQDKPELPAAPSSSVVTGMGASLVHLNANEDSSASSLWVDEEERAFYRDLPDLQEQVPIILLGGPKTALKDAKEEVTAAEFSVVAEPSESVLEPFSNLLLNDPPEMRLAMPSKPPHPKTPFQRRRPPASRTCSRACPR
jgi:hypothetical protein